MRSAKLFLEPDNFGKIFYFKTIFSEGWFWQSICTASIPKTSLLITLLKFFALIVIIAACIIFIQRKNANCYFIKKQIRSVVQERIDFAKFLGKEQLCLTYVTCRKDENFFYFLAKETILDKIASVEALKIMIKNCIVSVILKHLFA